MRSIKRILLLSFTPFLLLSQKEGVAYSFSCIEKDPLGTIISTFSDIESSFLHTVGTSVSIDEENSVGDGVLEDFKKKYKFIEGAEQEKVNKILSNLVKGVNNPKGFKYSIYVLDTTELNAFTVGGKIFITTKMLRFCVSDDEIAAIIGHEIAHNELGHIRDQISRFKSAQKTFGENAGGLSAKIGQMLITSFNQKDEVHCDLLGVDLVDLAGYQSCHSVELWKRMHKEHGNAENIPRIFLSHPYSVERSQCLKNHIDSNYSKKCP